VYYHYVAPVLPPTLRCAPRPGVLHLGEPEKFFSEALRVLRPGGRLGFTVWAAPPATEGFSITLDAVAAHGDPTVELPPGPPFFRYADADTVASDLEAAGFEGVASEVVAQEWTLPHAGALWE
jgi:SAM-dependent methyltransferase